MALFGLGKRKAKDELAKVLEGAEAPTFPALTLKILEKLRDPEVDFEELGEAIRWDPGLSLKLLGTVNSAAFSPKRPIEDVRHAASYLGRGQVESIVLAVAVHSSLPNRAKPGFEPSRYWTTAARRAALARAIASQLHPAQEGEAFTSALLLDLAVPVLANSLGAKYSEALLEWHASPGASLDELERDRLGLDHARVGGLLAESWDLPEGLSRCIALHHDSSVSDKDILPAIRLLAGVREVAPEDTVEALVESARTDYGLQPDWTLGSIESSKAEASELATLLAGG